MIYDIAKSYEENVKLGPQLKKKPISFLGHTLNSPIGIPAGPLLTSEWIALAGRLGFDLPTYKTIRSQAHPSHPLPNVTFVNHQGSQIPRPQKLSDITITNSFGMPSQSPDFLLQDIAKANASLASGQVMIVSIVGTGLANFIETALLAKSAGAKLIEANFSCPNVEKKEGILYLSPDTVEEYARAISKAIHPIPLILKVGAFNDVGQIKATLVAAARGKASAICGLNSVSMSIAPPLDLKRLTSGVCGASIRQMALHFIRHASQIIKDEKLDLALLGCGGIMEKGHFQEFLDAGAQIAMSATGMMFNPFLAMEFHGYSLSHS